MDNKFDITFKSKLCLITTMLSNEELKEKLALYEAIAPDIANKVQLYEEQQRIEKENKKREEKYKETIHNIPKAIEILTNDIISDKINSKIVKDVLELAFEKILNQEKRIQDLKKAIFETNNPSEFEFYPYCIQEHKFTIIQSKLEKGEFIIKEIYNNLHYPSDTFDNMYITNFGNILSMNINMLKSTISSLTDKLLSLIKDKHIISSSTTKVYEYFNVKLDFNRSDVQRGSERMYETKKNLLLKLYGCELYCCCNHFNGNTQGTKCNSPEEKSCAYPFYKATCNKNTELESFIIDAIKNHNFNAGLPIGRGRKDEHKLLGYGNFRKSFEEEISGEEIIKCFNKFTFGGFLKERIINFIEEIRKSSVEDLVVF